MSIFLDLSKTRRKQPLELIGQFAINDNAQALHQVQGRFSTVAAKGSK